MLAGDDDLLAPLSAIGFAPGRPLPDHCADRRQDGLVRRARRVRGGGYRVKFHPVPGLSIWVDGNLLVSSVPMARHGVTSVDVDLSEGTHVVQWQYDARSLPSTVAPEPSWHRVGPPGGPGVGPPEETAAGASTTADQPGAEDFLTPVVEGDANLLAPEPLDAIPPPPEGVVVQHYHLDALGSVRAVTDAAGTVIARHDFLPFGEEFSPQNPPVDRKLFTGQERDFETGMDYFNARQLRPDLGRFLTTDPLGELPARSSSQGFNAYSYVLNNPLRLIDPSGLAPEDRTHPVPLALEMPDNSITSFNSWYDAYGEAYELYAECVYGDYIAQRAATQPLVYALINAQDAAMNNPKFQPDTPTEGLTHCNQATWSVADAMSAPMEPLTDPQGKPLKAEQMRQNLAAGPIPCTGSGYREVSTDEAQQLASKGMLVIVSGPGHVATVRPDTGQAVPGSGAMIANVGKTVGVMRLSRVFKKIDLPQVRFYTPDWWQQ